MLLEAEWWARQPQLEIHVLKPIKLNDFLTNKHSSKLWVQYFKKHTYVFQSDNRRQFKKKKKLEQSCFTLLYQFLLYSKVNQLYVYTYSLVFWISFPFRPPQSVEQNSLQYTVGSYQLSVLYIVVYICQSQSPSSSPLTHSFQMFLFFCINIVWPFTT